MLKKFPQIGEKFWFVTESTGCQQEEYTGMQADKSLKAVGNIFRTRRQCQEASAGIRKVLSQLQKKFKN